jgi:dTDP-4-dehydrorhamnose 3,5-epimerase
MDIETTKFKDLNIISLRIHSDARGEFWKLFNPELANKLGFTEPIAQVNLSKSYHQGTFRGLHFQNPPYCESKMLLCLTGEIIDLAVDLRKGSSTFLQCFYYKLSSQDNKLISIPKGFAHGFQTLSDNTSLLYLHSTDYHPTYESGINYKDPRINLTLPLPIKNVSQRDREFNFLDQSFHGLDI